QLQQGVHVHSFSKLMASCSPAQRSAHGADHERRPEMTIQRDDEHLRPRGALSSIVTACRGSGAGSADDRGEPATYPPGRNPSAQDFNTSAHTRNCALPLTNGCGSPALRAASSGSFSSVPSATT